MDKWTFTLWGKTGGIVSEVTIAANNFDEAKKLAEQQSGLVAKGGIMQKR